MRRAWLAALNARGMVGHEMPCGPFAAAPPPWCNPRLGAAGATRSQGDADGSIPLNYKSSVAKPGSERCSQQLAPPALPSQQLNSPLIGAEFLDPTAEEALCVAL